MKKPINYTFPAVLTYEDGYEIAVTFPDLPGCATSGEDEIDALVMAREALGGHLYCMEEDGEPIPVPTALSQVSLEPNERAILVDVYMPSIRMAEETRAVNRTVTLPAWLNAAAMERNINFSQVLQKALQKELETA